jgi:membrane-bound lytic murein transglycosylase MltF
VPGFKPGFHQRLPDLRQLFQRGAKQVDTLAAGDFAVQLIAFRDLADGDQPVGVTSPAGMRGTME